MPGQRLCKRCGHPIMGSYLTALGATWHPEHFICAGCGKPVSAASFQLHQGAPYHIECYRNMVAPRCAYCGKPLMGEYLVDHWSTQFCQEHEHAYPHCAFCGRLVPPHEQEQGVANIRCATCQSTAIESAAAAKPIFTRLKQWVSSQGLVYNNLPISLELCDKAKLSGYLRERAQTHSLGATMSSTYTQNGRVIRSEVTGVAVLLGLPAMLFQGVTIHELGHVWLVVQGVQGLPSWAEEGFCELLSHRFYGEMHTPESQYHASSIEQNADPIYGEGFRRIRKLADWYGFSAFRGNVADNQAITCTLVSLVY